MTTATTSDTTERTRIAVLDHGYAKLVNSWGSDAEIVEAARMSTGKGFLGWGGPCDKCDGSGYYQGPRLGDEPCPKCRGEGKTTGDEKLLRYLYENKHATPFEMAGLTVEIEAPILVFRQWHRHRTQSYNEMSARYTPLPDKNYMPSVERLMVNSKKNKQAGTVKGAKELTEESATEFRAALVRSYVHAEELYQAALKSGVPKELARVHLPVARYSRMRASANLRNWLAFMTLRLDPHAQYEIRVYAEAVAEFIADRFPRTWLLFQQGKAWREEIKRWRASEAYKAWSAGGDQA